jgi:hypothetical protein
MILLKIKKPGLVLSVPGMASFRTPAEINVSNYDIRKLVAYLTSNSISEYEIISTDTPIKSVSNIYSNKEKIRKEESPNLEKRFNKLEKMLEYLIRKRKQKPSDDSEQISRNIDRVEDILRTKKEPIVEELSFIPDINISEMTISSGSYKEITNKDKKETEETADLLADLLKK